MHSVVLLLCWGAESSRGCYFRNIHRVRSGCWCARVHDIMLLMGLRRSAVTGCFYGSFHFQVSACVPNTDRVYNDDYMNVDGTGNINDIRVSVGRPINGCYCYRCYWNVRRGMLYNLLLPIPNDLVWSIPLVEESTRSVFQTHITRHYFQTFVRLRFGPMNNRTILPRTVFYSNICTLGNVFLWSFNVFSPRMVWFLPELII